MDPRALHVLAAIGLGLVVGGLGDLCVVRTSSLRRTPSIALLTAALFLACLWRFGWHYALLPGLTLVSLLVPLVRIDLERWMLPFALTLPGIAAGVLLSLPLGRERVEAALWGVAVGFLSLRALEYLGWLAFRREVLGGGDKYLLALLGAFLTARPLLAVVLLAVLQGALFGLVQWLRAGRESGEAALETEEAPEPRLTWRFLAPGLPLWRRVLLVPVSLLLQPIPDAPSSREELEATPGVTSLPFGPWLALAGLEVLLLG